MANKYEIPLSNEAQTFAIILNNIDYNILLTWNDFSQNWNISIYASDNTTLILSSIPLVTKQDLLAQFAYLELGGQLFVETDVTLDAIPTYDNLGSTSHLYFVTT